MLELIDSQNAREADQKPPPAAPLTIDRCRTLILNADHTPIRTMTWKEALNGLVRDILYPVECYDLYVSSPTRRIQLPAVAALRSYMHVYRPAQLTRRNLVLVYGMHCALCGGSFDADDLTREHLHPRSRGGANDWRNIVPACRPCNQGKGNKTLAEAGLHLKIPVKTAPTGLDVLKARLNIEFAEPPHPAWLDYIGHTYWDRNLDE
jgi:5-methylcytosine-specific restriction endonuclease McrA